MDKGSNSSSEWMRMPRWVNPAEALPQEAWNLWSGSRATRLRRLRRRKPERVKESIVRACGKSLLTTDQRITYARLVVDRISDPRKSTTFANVSCAIDCIVTSHDINRAALIDQIQQATGTLQKLLASLSICIRRAEPICLSPLSIQARISAGLRNSRKVWQANRVLPDLDVSGS